jgi:hypothetical protein
MDIANQGDRLGNIQGCGEGRRRALEQAGKKAHKVFCF